MSSRHTNIVDDRLAGHLRAYGCPELVRLDKSLSQPDQLDYLDLLPRRGVTTTEPLLAGVAKHQGAALLYVVDAISNDSVDAAKIAKLQRLLANRSDPAWLAVARPGSLDIYPIDFHAAAATTALDTISVQEDRAALFFQHLVHGTYEHNFHLQGSDYVFKKIFSLLEQTHEAFVPRTGIDPIHVLSMAGRALFFRFLIDRRIVLDNECPEISPAAAGLKDAFSSAEKAAQTSAWLDATFNGDFLPLIDESIPAADNAAREQAYLRFYRRIGKLGPGIFRHLHAILRGWTAVGGGHQTELDWGDLDFAHIPVGVLSQVYESFSHRVDSAAARKKSVHYTPRLIAQLMVDQAFAATPDPAAARILDPACGASIFLVLAFRRLVRERWQRDETRPNTRTIQSILYDQLRGFDVSEAALRLAALSLYITAIEVNGTPRPPKDLKFPKNLRGTVLHSFGETVPSCAKGTAFEIGSLGPAVPAEFNSLFDIVIGNPPWTRLREDTNEDETASSTTAKRETDVLNDTFTDIGRRVLRAKGLAKLAQTYENPDKNPDLPFLWRATEWARDDGIIALALPARIFGRTSGKGCEAWRAVLRSVSVTGLINGADLRKTPVWDGMDIPFCLLFARNTTPAKNHRFYFAAPLKEPFLNTQARFRIDYETPKPLGVERIEQQSWLLKALSVGTWLDVEVMEALLKVFPDRLSDIWKKWNRTRSRTGQGYNLSDGLEQMPAPFIANLKDFRPPSEGFSIRFSGLSTFKTNHGKETVYWTKGPDLYQPPLVVIPKAPGPELDTPKAYISSKPLAFSQSYYGYSCAGHPEADTLASLIYLTAHSTIFRHHTLMSSVTQGADRMMFTKQDLDALPFPDVATLDARTKTEIRKLAHRLEHDTKKPWDKIDAALFRLYGLDEDAVQVARDTLFSAASYRRQGRAALERTTRDSRATFRDALHDALEPYFDVCGAHAAVVEPAVQPDEWVQPWIFLSVTRADETAAVSRALLRKAMQLANKRSASRLVVKLPGRCGLLLGLLNQQRWWTATRARLCAQHLVRYHLAAFGLTEEA